MKRETMKKMLWMLPTAALLALTGCQSDKTEEAAAARTVTLTAADNGKIVRVRPGDRVEVQLDGNRTTGYVWQMEMVPPPGLRLIGETYRVKEAAPAAEAASEKAEAAKTEEAAPEKAEPLCGAPGVETFLYEAVVPGSWRLRGVYRRLFEKEIPKDAARFTVTIRVME